MQAGKALHQQASHDSDDDLIFRNDTDKRRQAAQTQGFPPTQGTAAGRRKEGNATKTATRVEKNATTREAAAAPRAQQTIPPPPPFIGSSTHSCALDGGDGCCSAPGSPAIQVPLYQTLKVKAKVAVLTASDPAAPGELRFQRQEVDFEEGAYAIWLSQIAQGAWHERCLLGLVGFKQEFPGLATDNQLLRASSGHVGKLVKACTAVIDGQSGVAQGGSVVKCHKHGAWVILSRAVTSPQQAQASVKQLVRSIAQEFSSKTAQPASTAQIVQHFDTLCRDELTAGTRQDPWKWGGEAVAATDPKTTVVKVGAWEVLLM